MSDYVIGHPVLLEATFAQAPTTVTLTVRKPDGSISTPSVNPTAAPTYSAIVNADQVGAWSYRFEGAGAYTAVLEEQYTVGASAVLAPGSPAYTYDPATPIGMVRLYTDDRDVSQVGSSVPLEQRSAIWSDAELQVFLNNNGDDPLLAAAEALTVMASNRQLLVQSRRIGQTTVNFGDVSGRLLALARDYREQAYAQAPASEFAEIAYTEFNARRIIANDILRNG